MRTGRGRVVDRVAVRPVPRYPVIGVGHPRQLGRVTGYAPDGEFLNYTSLLSGDELVIHVNRRAPRLS